MTVQDDAAALSTMVRGLLSRHRRQTYVVAQEFVDELLDVDLLAGRIAAGVAVLRLGNVTRLDFPSAGVKVTRVVPEEDRWVIRRGAYDNDLTWAWDLAGGAWLAAPAEGMDDFAFAAATTCSLAAALDTVGLWEGPPVPVDAKPRRVRR